MQTCPSLGAVELEQLRAKLGVAEQQHRERSEQLGAERDIALTRAESAEAAALELRKAVESWRCESEKTGKVAAHLYRRCV